MPKFRKKPMVIEAVQFNRRLPQALDQKTSSRLALLAGQPPDELYDLILSQNRPVIDHGDHLIIETLKGNHRADIGDWIIKGVQGELYPCKPDIFEATYELVEE